ncbi:MAG: hypothetical protein ACF8NJ_09550, partial [Phycisphaerales bacterium JB038]
MWFIRGVLLSALGGLLGAVIWAAVASALNMEVKLIAMLLAALCGLGMRLGAAEEADWMTGILAGVIAIFGVLIGKQMAVEYIVHEATTVDSRNVWAIADEVVFEWEQEGRQLDWPRGVYPDHAWVEADYPADVWDEAEYRYMFLSDPEMEDLAAYPFHATPDWQIVPIADEVLDEWLMDGEYIDWDGVVEADYPMREAEYPAEIWRIAKRRWERMDEAEKRAHERAVCAQWDVENAEFTAWLEEQKQEMYKSSFGGRNLYLLAIA